MSDVDSLIHGHGDNRWNLSVVVINPAGMHLVPEPVITGGSQALHSGQDTVLFVSRYDDTITV